MLKGRKDEVGVPNLDIRKDSLNTLINSLNLSIYFEDSVFRKCLKILLFRAFILKNV